MDTTCVVPTFSCHVHRHQLCNDIKDGVDESDESGSICMCLTERKCRRKYLSDQPMRLPNAWILDGIEDCLDGIDEYHW